MEAVVPHVRTALAVSEDLFCSTSMPNLMPTTTRALHPTIAAPLCQDISEGLFLFCYFAHLATGAFSAVDPSPSAHITRPTAPSPHHRLLTSGDLGRPFLFPLLCPPARPRDRRYPRHRPLAEHSRQRRGGRALRRRIIGGGGQQLLRLGSNRGAQRPTSHPCFPSYATTQPHGPSIP